MYYVGFSTATVVASLILFQGFNTTDATNTLSLLCGFVVTFLGVHLLNISRIPDPILPQNGHHTALESGLMNPRLSLQGRASLDAWGGVSGRPEEAPLVGRHSRRNSLYRSQTLFNAFEDGVDGTEAVGLHRLREEDEEEDVDEQTHLHSADEQSSYDQHSKHGSRSHSHSPTPQNNNTRISPHPT
jgi:magnesium transporter